MTYFLEDKMELLKQRILKDGKVIGNDILKVDSFLNHQMDVQLFNEMGKEFYKLFADKDITKILTIESSGIGIACIAAQYFNVPVVFAKKSEAKNLDFDAYLSEVFSFTKDKTYTIRVSKNYISSNDTILIIDDFLANGKAALGLAEIVEQAGARLGGVGIAIEKGFQDGGQLLRESGINLKSLAIVNRMHDGVISFAE
jgi:xanthine phosphoribosyltransferase